MIIRASRENFIKAKYDEKRFVRKFEGTEEEHQKEMLDKCNSGDLYGVMKCIMQGIDVNYLVDTEKKVALLSQVVIDGNATTYILELLIQNGAQVYTTDINGWTPLHYAAHYDRVTMARMLMMRGGSITQEDKQQRTPTSIAQEQSDSQTLKYFNKEISDDDLAGVQQTDIKSLNEIKANFDEGVDVIRMKLNMLRQELKVTESVEDAIQILKKIRLVKLSLCFDAA